MPSFMGVIQFAWRNLGFFAFFISIVCAINTVTFAEEVVKKELLRYTFLFAVIISICVFSALGVMRDWKFGDLNNEKVFDKYLSENEEIVKVSQDGKAQGIKEGEAIIKVSNINGEAENQIKIIVSKNQVEKIEIDDNNVEIGKNQRYILSATVSPDNATYKNVTWSSSNESILKIDQNGIVTAKGIGKTTVLAITDNGDKQVECAFNVVKSPKENKVLYAKGKNSIRVKADKSSKSLAVTGADEEVELLKKLNN